MRSYNKFILLYLLSISILFLFTGCYSKDSETPVEGLSFENFNNGQDLLGFTYLMNYGSENYKLYCDNFSKIVWVKYTNTKGMGQTKTGEGGFSPLISANGNYYVINTETRVISELSPSSTPSTETDENVEDQSSSDVINSNPTLDQEIQDQLNENQNKN